MSFNSLEFLIFLGVVFTTSWALSHRLQNLFLLAASYLFYGWWDARFLLLILASSLLDFECGRRIHAAPTERARRRWLMLSMTANLGALAAFKYFQFFLDSTILALHALGFAAQAPTLAILLPAGISFYTFQTMSYTIDIYRRRLAPTDDLVAFLAFVSFFPQLVAGPIERAQDLLPQFLQPRRFDTTRAIDGARQMLYGLFLKVVIADNLAPVVDRSFLVATHPGAQYYLGAILFGFQLYGDFAGYSHIAIGCARFFGIELRQNFAYPYFSRNISEFWLRWHISLSSWFRDYLYIPLGGSRAGPRRRAANVITTFTISGLWHGAGFQFIAWGLFHGLIVALQGPAPTNLAEPCGPTLLPSPRDLLRVLATIHLAAIGWVFFRSPSLAFALGVFGTIGRDLIEPGGLPAALAVLTRPGNLTALATTLAFLTIEWLGRHHPHPMQTQGWPRAARLAADLACAAAIVLLGQVKIVPFYYFQF